MKRFMFALCAALLCFAGANLVAQDNTENANEPLLIALQDDSDILCNFDCPISSEKEAVRCFEVRDCESVPEERIKQAINDLADECCRKLKACCAENGCDEFKCELAKYEWWCASKHRLCIRIKVIFKCQ